MNENVCKELYAEIERILPSLKYCLAPEKVSKKHGTSSLRSGTEGTVEEVKDVSTLATHAKTLYEWLDVSPKSKIRMLMNWQAAAGISFVACTHHRSVQCFRYHGNTSDDETEGVVTLAEFQESIKIRHQQGASGINVDPQSNDF